MRTSDVLRRSQRSGSEGNIKYKHVTAILRYETDADRTTPIEFCVTVKKVVSDPDYAAREVKRLNALNQDKGAYYFTQITRLEEVSLEVQAGNTAQGATTEQPRA